MAWVVVTLIAAIFGYVALFSSDIKKEGVLRTDKEKQVVAKGGMEFLFHMRQAGHLPGVTTNEHGFASISGQLSAYPYSLIMQFSENGKAFTNNYSIVQMKKDSSWQLTRAWQTDSNGQIIQEWSVK